MNIQDEDWDEFDLEDDFDESWDEDDSIDIPIAEPKNSEKAIPLDIQPSETKSDICDESSPVSNVRTSKKKKNPAFFILTVALLSSGAATYYFVSTNNIDAPMPVIKLEGVSQTKSQNAEVETPLIEASTQPGYYNSEPKSVSSNVQQNSILTPFPNDIEDQDVALPDLFEVHKEVVDIEKAAAVITTPTIAEQPLVNQFVEEDILLKTEKSFEVDAPIIPSQVPQSGQNYVHATIVEKNVPVEIKSAAKKAQEPVAKPITQEAVVAVEISENLPATKTELDAVVKSPTPKAKQEAAIVSTETVKAQVPAKIETPTAAKPNWVIRAAQPGKAVLRDTISGEVRSVEAGDNVSGLGKVKSITKKSGHWVVTGTQNSVQR